MAGESTVTIINPLTLKAVLSHYGLLNVSQELGDFRLHIQDKNNPHETDKNSVELNKVENRGVAPNEDVLANRDNEGLISLTQLKTYLRTHGCVTAPEGEPTYPEKGALLSYRCTSNYDRIGLFADGMGHTYEKIVEPNSLECGYKAPEKNNYPPHGTILQYYCLDFDRWKSGWKRKQTTTADSLTCNQPYLVTMTYGCATSNARTPALTKRYPRSLIRCARCATL